MCNAKLYFIKWYEYFDESMGAVIEKQTNNCWYSRIADC